MVVSLIMEAYRSLRDQGGNLVMLCMILLHLVVPFISTSSGS